MRVVLAGWVVVVGLAAQGCVERQLLAAGIVVGYDAAGQVGVGHEGRVQHGQRHAPAGEFVASVQSHVNGKGLAEAADGSRGKVQLPHPGGNRGSLRR